MCVWQGEGEMYAVDAAGSWMHRSLDYIIIVTPCSIWLLCTSFAECFPAQIRIWIVTWWLSQCLCAILNMFRILSSTFITSRSAEIPLVWYHELCMLFYRYHSSLLCFSSHILIINVSQTKLPHCLRIHGCVCFSDPVLRGTIASGSSDVRPLNPGVPFPMSLV